MPSSTVAGVGGAARSKCSRPPVHNEMKDLNPNVAGTGETQGTRLPVPGASETQLASEMPPPPIPSSPEAPSRLDNWSLEKTAFPRILARQKQDFWMQMGLWAST